uniref:Uncharacterized protein n=1 Tax=Glossina brevipalpis TaxID=37001 RepID=A0A1A9WVI9_9MUSC
MTMTSEINYIGPLLLSFVLGLLLLKDTIKEIALFMGRPNESLVEKNNISRNIQQYFSKHLATFPETSSFAPQHVAIVWTVPASPMFHFGIETWKWSVALKREHGTWVWNIEMERGNRKRERNMKTEHGNGMRKWNVEVALRPETSCFGGTINIPTFCWLVLAGNTFRETLNARLMKSRII